MPKLEEIRLRKNDINIPPKTSAVKANPIRAGSTPFKLSIVGKVTKLIPTTIAESKTLRKSIFNSLGNFKSESMKGI